jgi:hypothetical protein
MVSWTLVNFFEAGFNRDAGLDRWQSAEYYLCKLPSSHCGVPDQLYQTTKMADVSVLLFMMLLNQENWKSARRAQTSIRTLTTKHLEIWHWRRDKPSSCGLSAKRLLGQAGVKLMRHQLILATNMGPIGSIMWSTTSIA